MSGVAVESIQEPHLLHKCPYFPLSSSNLRIESKQILLPTSASLFLNILHKVSHRL